MPLGDRLPALGEYLILVFYLDWSALAAEHDLPYPVVSDNSNSNSIGNSICISITISNSNRNNN